MKTHYNYYIFLVLLLTQHLRAQEISYELLHDFSLADMDSIAQEWNLPSAILNLQYPVKIYRIHYETLNAQGTDITQASGALAVPQGYVCPVPLTTYLHGTIAHRQDAPSYGSSEMYIGMFFAAMGNVVAMPDYLGLGDSPGLHPYVHAHSEASASIDMLRATRSLSETLAFPMNEQLFIFGYSQGGHAAMALHRELQLYYGDEFTVTASAPMSGPYDISGAQTQYLIADTPYATPGYLPYVAFAYQSVYGDLYEQVSDFLVSPYDTLLPPLFDGEHSMGYINDLCTPVPKNMIQPQQLEAFINDINHPFRKALRDNDVYDWKPEAPMVLCYCKGDDQVSYQNTIVAYDKMIANGSTNVVKMSLGDNLDHGGCVMPSLFTGKDLFDGLRELSNGMAISFVPSYPSNSTAADGAIAVEVSGGAAGYTYQWNNGSTNADLNNIGVGTYTLTVTDDLGCSITRSIELTTAVGINEATATTFWRVLQNPVYDHTLRIAAPMNEEEIIFTINNTLGQVVYERKISATPTIQIDLSALPAGLYQYTATNIRYMQQNNGKFIKFF